MSADMPGGSGRRPGSRSGAASRRNSENDDRPGVKYAAGRRPDGSRPAATWSPLSVGQFRNVSSYRTEYVIVRHASAGDRAKWDGGDLSAEVRVKANGLTLTIPVMARVKE